MLPSSSQAAVRLRLRCGNQATKASQAFSSLKALSRSGLARHSAPTARSSRSSTARLASGISWCRLPRSPPKPRMPNWLARVARKVRLPSTLRPHAAPNQSLVAATYQSVSEPLVVLVLKADAHLRPPDVLVVDGIAQHAHLGAQHVHLRTLAGHGVAELEAPARHRDLDAVLHAHGHALDVEVELALSADVGGVRRRPH